MRGFTGQATIRHADGVNWVLVEPLSYIDRHGVTWGVPVGATTDLASVPSFVAWVVARTGRSVSPAILHDHLWRTLVPARVLDYRRADRTLRDALLDCGVPLAVAWLMWAAVRLGSLTRPSGHNAGWWRDAPAVAAITVAAAPVVVPPAALCLAALLVFALINAAAAVAAGRPGHIGRFTLRS